MRRTLAAVALVGIVGVVGVTPAFGADRHPPKFGVHDSNCAAGPDQPWCPGNH